MKRYACVHGHFYQPPRENPWTGEVERQLSAAPDHDWNARVARECYIPNGEARVMNGAGRIVDVVDNYAWLSFDFGPTLLAWLEKAHPHAYRRLLEADGVSAARLDGHGNALAQPYHHAILPLAHPRDRVTEIRWGLVDFRHRFGRRAEGLWLPECAADEATLAAIAAEGVGFVILESGQAETPPLAGVPYSWRGPDGARLALFFYDGGLSRAVAFEKAMSDSRAFAGRVASKLHADPAAACLLATDGESYGHHDSFAEMGLAHLLRYALPEAGVEPVNLAWFLAKHPPREEIRLKRGGTSWSCPHGIERWRADCGCGAAEGRHQRWRKPLREALEGLRGKLADIYEKNARGVLDDPWAARDAYIAVVLDRSEESTARFLAAHAPGAKGRDSRRRALKLLELQRHSLMMFTSCGWFFDEISRLEPVQVLLYAARAIELAREFGADLEPEFVRSLSLAPSNDASLRDGAGVWEKAVKPQIVTPDHVAAHYGVSLLFEESPPEHVHHHGARSGRVTRRVEGGVSIAAARTEFTEGATGEVWSRSFVAALLPGQRVQAFVCAGDLAEDRFEALLASAGHGGQEAALPPGRLFLLRDLRPDERERVLTLVLKRRLARWEEEAAGLLDEALPLVEQFHGLGLPLPPGLAEEARLSLAHAAAAGARRFAEGVFGAVEESQALLARARAAGIEVPLAGVERSWSLGMSRLLDDLEKNFQESALRALRDAARVSTALGLSDWRPSAQTRYFRLLKSRLPPSELAVSAREAAAALGIELG